MNFAAAQVSAYEDASAEVDEILHGEIAALVARKLGNTRRGQVAVALALTTAAGNAVAALVSHERAEQLHRQRAAHHRAKAARSMPIARRCR